MMDLSTSPNGEWGWSRGFWGSRGSAAYATDALFGQTKGLEKQTQGGGKQDELASG